MRRNTFPKTFILATICLGFALAASGLAWSRGREGLPSKRGGPIHDVFLMEKYAEQLNLDAKTLEQIRGIVAASKEESNRLRTELREAHMTMRDLLSAEAPDEKAIMEQAEKIGAIRNNLAKNHLRVLLQIRPLLTTDQVRELGKIREEHRSRRREWGPSHRGGAFDHQRGMDLDSRISRLTQRLSLTEEQQTEIRSILEQKMQKMQAMREEKKKLRQETDAKIQGVLTDEQQAEFSQLRKEMQHRHGPGVWGGAKEGGSR